MAGDGVKYDDGKPAVDLLDPETLLAVAMVLTYGARKYRAHNWRNGLSWSRLFAGTMRHLLAFGDYSPGRWGWMLRDVRPLAVPVPARGQQGLWQVEVPATAELAGAA